FGFGYYGTRAGENAAPPQASLCDLGGCCYPRVELCARGASIFSSGGRRSCLRRLGSFDRRHFPLPRFRRAEDGIDNRHVPDRILERIGRRSETADGLREQVGLNRVLIAGVHFDSLDAAARQVSAIVDKQPARPIA